MKHPTAPQTALRVMRWLTAVAAATAGILTAAHTVMLYLEGKAGGGQVYTIERISAHAGAAAWAVIVFALLALITGIAGLWIRPEREASVPATPRLRENLLRRKEDEAAKNTRLTRTVRIAILTVAVLLVTLGLLNGGMHDVLVKAINICTECIGLG